MREVLKIPYPKTAAGKKHWAKEYGLNAYYAGKHWSRRRDDAAFWHEMVRNAIIQQGVRKTPFQGPVVLRFTWNDRLDLSNHAVMAKMIEDALRGWVIRDDSRKYVKAILHDWGDQDYIRVEIAEE